MESAAQQQTKAATPKLLDEVRARIRVKHYSLRTEEACCGWIIRFIRHNGMLYEYIRRL